MGVWRKVLQAVLNDDGSPSMYSSLIEQRPSGDRPGIASHESEARRKDARPGARPPRK